MRWECHTHISPLFTSLQEGSHTKDIPMASSKLLSRHKDSPDFDHHFNYRHIVGKLNFLEQSTRGDISYATHMLAGFSTCPKVQHGAAVKWLGRYLLGTRDKGIILTRTQPRAWSFLWMLILQELGTPNWLVRTLTLPGPGMATS